MIKSEVQNRGRPSARPLEDGDSRIRNVRKVGRAIMRPPPVLTSGNSLRPLGTGICRCRLAAPAAMVAQGGGVGKDVKAQGRPS